MLHQMIKLPEFNTLDLKYRTIRLLYIGIIQMSIAHCAFFAIQLVRNPLAISIEINEKYFRNFSLQFMKHAATRGCQNYIGTDS